MAYPGIQERTGKMVPLDHKELQELQEVLVSEAQREILETVSQDPEDPLVHQDLLDLELVTVKCRRFLIWRDQDWQIWTKSEVSLVLQAPQGSPVPRAFLGLQWPWDPKEQ